MRLIPADAMRHIPRKSGSGVATETATAPVGTTLDRFGWCMNTAQVDAAGPFSRFAGIGRSLATIADGRLATHRTEAETVTLVSDEAPTRFPDETGVHTMLDAPLSDFDVMTWHDARAHHAEAIVLTASERCPLLRLYTGMQWPVYCVHGVLSIGADDVPQGAAVWLDAEDDPDTIIARVGSVGYLAALWLASWRCQIEHAKREGTPWGPL